MLRSAARSNAPPCLLDGSACWVAAGASEWDSIVSPRPSARGGWSGGCFSGLAAGIGGPRPQARAPAWVSSRLVACQWDGRF